MKTPYLAILSLPFLTLAACGSPPTPDAGAIVETVSVKVFATLTAEAPPHPYPHSHDNTHGYPHDGAAHRHSGTTHCHPGATYPDTPTLPYTHLYAHGYPHARLHLSGGYTYHPYDHANAQPHRYPLGAQRQDRLPV